MNLRSPAAIRTALPSLRVVVQHPRDFGFRRRRIELEVALEHVVNHRRRRAAAMAAVLDDAGGCDGRIVLRCERDEPRVILELLRRFVFGLVLARRTFVADNLRGAGFTAYDDVVEMRLVRGAADAVEQV